MYYVYALKSLKDKRFYFGFTKDLEKRIGEHNAGLTESTKNRRPFKLVYYEVYLNKKDVIVREKYFKTGWGRNFIKKNIKYYLEEDNSKE